MAAGRDWYIFMITSILHVSPFDVLPSVCRPASFDDLNKHQLKLFLDLARLERSATDVQLRLLRARDLRILCNKSTSKRGSAPHIQTADFTAAIDESRKEQFEGAKQPSLNKPDLEDAHTPVARPPVPGRYRIQVKSPPTDPALYSAPASQTSNEVASKLIARLNLQRDSKPPLEESLSVSPPAILSALPSAEAPGRLAKTSKRERPSQFEEQMHANTDNKRRRDRSASWGSDTSEDMPILDKLKLKKELSASKLHGTPIQNRLSSKTWQTKKSTLSLTFDRSIPTPTSMSRETSGKIQHDLNRSKRRLFAKSAQPNVIPEDELVKIIDFDSISYPVETPVPHEPGTYRYIENAEDLRVEAEKFRQRSKRVLHDPDHSSNNLVTDQPRQARDRPHPTRILLDQLKEQVGNHMFFIVASARSYKGSPITREENARLDELEGDFLADFVEAREKFEVGLKDMGLLPRTHPPIDGLPKVFGQLPVWMRQMIESSPPAKESPSATEYETVSPDATIIDLQADYVTTDDDES